jgi:hypothetical protein
MLNEEWGQFYVSKKKNKKNRILAKLKIMRTLLLFTLSFNLRLSVAEHVGVVVTLYILILGMLRSNLSSDIRYPEHFRGFSQSP